MLALRETVRKTVGRVRQRPQACLGRWVLRLALESLEKKGEPAQRNLVRTAPVSSPMCFQQDNILSPEISLMHFRTTGKIRVITGRKLLRVR